MGRGKAEVQKEIQAFKYKQTVANVTWEQAADRHGVKTITIKRINTLYNELNKSGYNGDFDSVISRLQAGMALTSVNFEWIQKHTSTFSGALKQLKTFVENQEIDITEIDPNTGTYVVKESNVFADDFGLSKYDSFRKEELVLEAFRLEEEVNELKKLVEILTEIRSVNLVE